jgi:short-subunit dehydrogenase
MAYQFALITGASSGIGAAFARELTPETGLLLTGRDRNRLADLAEDLSAKERQVETVAADLAQAAGREAVIAAARDHPIDLLINNAGVGRLGRLIDNPPEREEEMVTVNCLAPVLLTRALLPDMLARAEAQGRRAGVIVVASTLAFFPMPLMATYAATKAFDLALAEGLAGEMVGEPVDVLALCPGATDTEFFARSAMGTGSLMLADPQKVARDGLAALGNRPVHLVGISSRLSTLAGRLVPRALLFAGARQAAKRLRLKT